MKRTVTIRFAQGDTAGVTAIARIHVGARPHAELRLNSRNPRVGFDYDADSAGYAYEIEYQWGYAREAWHRGQSDTDELILPFPGSEGNASFAFPRRG
jgi:hypothetical protein